MNGVMLLLLLLLLLLAAVGGLWRAARCSCCRKGLCERCGVRGAKCVIPATITLSNLPCNDRCRGKGAEFPPSISMLTSEAAS